MKKTRVMLLLLALALTLGALPAQAAEKPLTDGIYRPRHPHGGEKRRGAENQGEQHGIGRDFL